MPRVSRIAAVVLVLATAAQAQPDLSALPAVIKDLKWKEIDPAALSAQERCSALKFMMEALDELGAAGGAEADLMSEFIDQKELGPQFADLPPGEGAPFTYDDALKISVAMLRGPLAESSYATEFADQTDPRALGAYERLFQSTCNRKWSEVAEAKVQIRAMSAFLRDQKLTDAYREWLPTEIERREQAHAEAMAKRRAEQKVTEEARAQAAKEAQEERRARQEQQAAAREMERALRSAQQAEAAPPSGDVVIDDDDDDDYLWYPAYGRAGSRWYAEPEYRGNAGANVERRMNKWSGARRGGGRRR